MIKKDSNQETEQWFQEGIILQERPRALPLSVEWLEKWGLPGEADGVFTLREGWLLHTYGNGPARRRGEMPHRTALGSNPKVKHSSPWEAASPRKEFRKEEEQSAAVKL